jgi:hypothetical protein
MFLTPGFNMERLIKKMGCSKEEGEWLKTFAVADAPPVNQRTLDDLMKPRRKHTRPNQEKEMMSDKKKK